jgi:hypothetical protein
MPPGVYDVMAAFRDGTFAFVVHEGVSVSGDKVMAVDPSEATARFDFANVGPDGAPLNCNSGLLTFYDIRSGWGFGYIGFPFDQVMASFTSGHYRLDWGARPFPSQKISVSGGVTGIGGSQTFTNRPGRAVACPGATIRPRR